MQCGDYIHVFVMVKAEFQMCHSWSVKTTDTKTRSIPRIPWLGPISSRFQLPRKWVVVFGSSFTFLATGAHSGLVLATTVGNRNGTSSFYTIMSLNPACWSENPSDTDIPWGKVWGGEWCIFSESCRSSEFMCSVTVFRCVVICFTHTVMHVWLVTEPAVLTVWKN